MGTTTDLDPTPLDHTGWQTVFFDGFNGTQLDWAKWPITYGGSTYWNGAFRWDQGQLSVGNGELTIGMDRQADGLWNVGGLSTAPYPGAPDGVGHGFLYGRVEIRAKTSVEVVGAGPCFLLWPTSNDHWPPEIDILETPANGQGMFTNHWQGPGGNNDDRYESRFFELDHSQWHTYALDWLPDRLTLYVDGTKVAEITQNIPAERMSVGLQGHVGTAWDGWYGSPNGSGIDSVDISVDWVRVSQYTGATPPPPAPPPEPPAAPAPDRTITGTAGSDTLRGSAGTDLVSGAAGADRLLGLDGADTLLGGAGDDSLVGGTGADSLGGGDGNDLLRGDAGNDTIATGAGRDVVVFTTGDGADRVTDFVLGTDKVRLPGIETATVTAGLATVEAVAGLKLTLAGGDSLFLDGLGLATARQLGLAGSFAATSTAPAPVLNAVAGTPGDDSLLGTAGADSIAGGGGNDDLRGLDGNDLLRGGKGADMVGGGGGTDTFVFARGDGQDWILDFAPGTEKIRLEGITAADITQSFDTRWGHWGVAIDFGQGDGIFLDWATEKLAASDFVFA